MVLPRRLAQLLLTAAVALVLLAAPALALPGVLDPDRHQLAAAVSARADGEAEDDVVRDLTIDIAVRDDGSLAVREIYAWDFGDREGLGMTRILEQLFDYEPDAMMNRRYEYADFAVTSPSGAPAEVWVVADDGAFIELAIGAPDGSSDRRSGVQTYVLTYTVDGALNAIRDDPTVSDRDELYWNVTGHDWQVPIESLTTTVTGPAEMIAHGCFEGSPGSDQTCTGLVTEPERLVGTSADLAPGEGQTVVAAFPPGTFTDLSPVLVPDEDAARAAEVATWSDPLARVLVNPWTGAGAIVGLVLLVRYRLRRGRDRHFTTVPPGTLPPDPSTAATAPLEHEPAETVRFTPPEQLRVAEAGALLTERVTSDVVSATIVDLAVRGYLVLEEAGTDRHGTVDDWRLTRIDGAAQDELTDYERGLYDALFEDRTTVTLSELQNTFATKLRDTRQALRARIDARQLFVGGIGASSGLGLWGIATTVLLLVAGSVLVLVAVADWLPGSAWLLVTAGSLLALAVPVALAATAKAANGRTAYGRALYDQARGFRRYLATAEAEQLRWEEGQDIFSRYLPWAMVFGEVDRWVEVFARLAEEGKAPPPPSWYVGIGGHIRLASFGSAMSSFSTASTASLSSTPGSSGGSGAGGFSGGGGGGGGGGGR